MELAPETWQQSLSIVLYTTQRFVSGSFEKDSISGAIIKGIGNVQIEAKSKTCRVHNLYLLSGYKLVYPDEI